MLVKYLIILIFHFVSVFSIILVHLPLKVSGLSKMAIFTISINIGIDVENQTLINHLGSAETEHGTAAFAKPLLAIALLSVRRWIVSNLRNEIENTFRYTISFICLVNPSFFIDVPIASMCKPMSVMQQSL